LEFLNEVMRISTDLWKKGWAERNAGNISMRLSADDIGGLGSIKNDAPWNELQKKVPDLGGEVFLISGTGKYLKNIALDPERNLGIIEIDKSGEKYKVIWGYSDGGSPSCELPSHLDVHSIKKTAAGSTKSTIIHTHPSNLIALTYSLELDTYKLTRLLWEMHVECIAVIPEGVEFLPWMVAGSNELADATAEAFIKRNVVVWQYHGAFGWGRNPDEVLGLIDTVEKAAEIFIKASSTGPVRSRLKPEQLGVIAQRFGAIPDKDIMEYMKKNCREA
jgi:rhamnulose-1-phosphate aldolase